MFLKAASAYVQVVPFDLHFVPQLVRLSFRLASNKH